MYGLEKIEQHTFLHQINQLSDWDRYATAKLFWTFYYTIVLHWPNHLHHHQLSGSDLIKSGANIFKICSLVLFRYWFSEDCLTQSNPFCTSIISSNQITMAHSDDITIKNCYCYQRRKFVVLCKCYDEFRTATLMYPYFFFFKIWFHDMFPQLPVQPSTTWTRTYTLHSDPILFLDGTCHNYPITNQPPPLHWPSYPPLKTSNYLHLSP